MRRDFLNQLIEKYFEQLIDSVEFYSHIDVILRQTVLNIVVPRHAPAHMRCTAALDESVHQIWRNRIVYS